MDRNKRIEEGFHDLYFNRSIPCSIASLMLLSEFYNLPLDQQVLDSAIGMVGAGKTGKQCGLLEAGLMFIGIMAKKNGIPRVDIVKICGKWTEELEELLGNTECRNLRPFPFKPEDAPKHLCLPISVKAVKKAVQFIDDNLIPVIEAMEK